VITTKCTCGESFKSDDEHGGRTIRCRCGRLLEIGSPPPSVAPRPEAVRGSERKAVTESHDGSNRVARWFKTGNKGVWAVAAAALVLFVFWGLVKLGSYSYTSGPPVSAGSERPTAQQGATAPSRTYRPENPFRPDRSEPMLAVPPSCPVDSLRRPVSGAELGGKRGGGMGRLRIENGTVNDAIGVLVDARTGDPVRAIYIRQDEAGLIAGVSVGEYRLRFQFGRRWHLNRYFCDVAGAAEFDLPFEFTEERKGDGIEYSIYEVTLHPVPEGEAKTHEVPAWLVRLPPLADEAVGDSTDR
jgi:hypothetical protein